MPHTPLAKLLRHAASTAAQSKRRDATADDSAMSRREFVRTISAATAGLALPASLFGAKQIATAPRIVVVGAGLAGLTCAYRLTQAGYSPQVYETSQRVGGRCWTIRGVFADGQIAQHGGELIDQGHTAIRQLAQELGLNLDNLLAAEPNGTEDFYLFDGGRYTFEEATRDLKGIWQQIHSDLSAASYPTLYNLSTQRGRDLDAMSIAQYIDSYVPGGRKSNLGQLLDTAYNIEYGAETTRQSSLNLLYLLGYSGPGQFRVFGKSNEKYHVVGGNDQIAERLAQRVQGQITLGSALVSIGRNGDGSYALTFDPGGRAVTAD